MLSLMKLESFFLFIQVSTYSNVLRISQINSRINDKFIDT